MDVVVRITLTSVKKYCISCAVMIICKNYILLLTNIICCSIMDRISVERGEEG